jgi:hypothetical protein
MTDNVRRFLEDDPTVLEIAQQDDRETATPTERDREKL